MKFTSSSNRFLTVAVVLVFVSIFFLNGEQAAASAISDFNLIALGDLTGTSEVDGRTVVFGDISGSAKNFGVNTEAIADPVDTDGLNQTDSLIVGGQIKTTVQVNNGGVRIQGSEVTGVQVNNNSGYYPIYNDDDVADILNDVFLDVESLTSMLDDLEADSTVNFLENKPTFISTPGDDNIAVFDIDAALFSKNGQLDIAGDNLEDTFFVIRVSGEEISINGVNFGYEFLDEAYQDQIIWYFADATELTIGRAMGGSVIAPNADVTLWCPVDGTLVGQNINLSGEVHLPSSDTPPDNSVPEPATALLLGLGMLFLGFCGKRRYLRP